MAFPLPKISPPPALNAAVSSGPQSEIDSEITRLGNSISLCMNKLDSLLVRIDPVLAAPAPPKPEESVQAVPTCRLADSMQVLRRQIDSISRALEDAYERLAL